MVNCFHCGERGMGNGEWGTGNGEWGTGNGERGTGNGEWGTGNGERGMGNGLVAKFGHETIQHLAYAIYLQPHLVRNTDIP